MEKCKNCKYYLHSPEPSLGICRRYPPVAVGMYSQASIYPKVDGEFTACGEFKAIENITNQTNKKGKK